MNDKASPFYIREKIEIAVVAERIAPPYVKEVIIVMLILYMYGAICLKFVSGAESFDAGLAYAIWGYEAGLQDWLGFDPYYFGLTVFGFFSLYFSFGNIENAKVLQIVTTILRFLCTILMCIGAIYYMGSTGSHRAPVFDWSQQIKHFAQVFGNTTFVFIYHHSISGIVYPIRPQKDIKKMFLYSNIIGSIFLGTEAILAYFAFSSLDNFCVKPLDWDPTEPFEAHFPCAVSGLYNENFLKLPGIGQICNFYPMLNIAAVPILNITLRNNLLDVIPVKRWIRNSGKCLCLLDDHKRSIKGLWSIILTIPVISIVLFYRNV